MIGRENAFGYDIQSRRVADEGRRVRFGVFRCTTPGCTESIERRIPDGKHNPEMVAKHAIQAGWRAEPFANNRTLCPTHNGRPTRRPGEAMSEPKTTRPILRAVAAPSGTAVATPPPLPVAPTGVPRQAIRSLLDTYFDAAKGEYAAGASDAQIADEAGATVEQVATIREAAYGPILVTAATLAARAELAKLTAAVEALDARYRGILTEAEAVTAKAKAAGEELAQARTIAAQLAAQIGAAA